MGPRVTGVSFVDISTGEFYLAQGSLEYTDNLLQSFRPMEVIVQKNKLREFKETYGDKFYTATFEDWVFTPDFAYDILQKHFGTTSLKGFGVDELEAGVIASGAALHYLAETQHDKVSHISKLSRIEEDHYVWLDKFTVRNLELLHSANENALTLIDVIDQTLTPMGSRTLKRWMVMPLKDKLLIDERLDITEDFITNEEEAEKLRKEVKGIGDLERLIGKVAIGRIQPREVLQIKRALTSV
jgi:DNA mismatch repair protein MutS